MGTVSNSKWESVIFLNVYVNCVDDSVQFSDTGLSSTVECESIWLIFRYTNSDTFPSFEKYVKYISRMMEKYYQHFTTNNK